MLPSTATVMRLGTTLGNAARLIVGKERLPAAIQMIYIHPLLPPMTGVVQVKKSA